MTIKRQESAVRLPCPVCGQSCRAEVVLKHKEAASVPQSPNNEEMESYRMALAYISKQSSDQQSRELAETALADTRPLRGGER